MSLPLDQHKSVVARKQSYGTGEPVEIQRQWASLPFLGYVLTWKERKLTLLMLGTMCCQRTDEHSRTSGLPGQRPYLTLLPLYLQQVWASPQKVYHGAVPKSQVPVAFMG